MFALSSANNCFELPIAFNSTLEHLKSNWKVKRQHFHSNGFISFSGAIQIICDTFLTNLSLSPLSPLSLPSLPNLTFSDIFVYPLNVNINCRKIRIALGLIIDSLYENAMPNNR